MLELVAEVESRAIASRQGFGPTARLLSGIRRLSASEARPDVIRALRAGEQDDDRELSAVRDQLATARTRHEELVDALAAGTVGVALAARSEPVIRAEIERLEQREKDLATPGALRGLIEPGTDVGRRWTAAPMSTRHQVAKLLLTPALIGELRIVPSPIKGHRAPVEDRIKWHREQSARVRRYDRQYGAQSLGVTSVRAE
jgi:hypothetical protein